MKVTPGSTDVTTYVSMVLSADGSDATGLTITDLDLQYVRSGAAPVAKVDATALAATNSAHGDNQAIEIDSTDQPGLYRVDWPDAAFAAGVREVILTVKHSTCRAAHLRVEIETIQTGDSFARLGAPTGASVSADILAIDDFVDTEITAIKAKTDQLTFTTANQVDAQPISIAAGAITATAIAADAITAAKVASDVGTEFADALLNRDMSTGTDSGSTTVRTPRQALRFLRNKWEIVGTTLTVYKENDSTASWDSEVTGTAGADPITANDPGGP